MLKASSEVAWLLKSIKSFQTHTVLRDVCKLHIEHGQVQWVVRIYPSCTRQNAVPQIRFSHHRRVIWVPLCGPLNPANVSIGSGHFRQVSEILKNMNFLLICFVKGPSLKFDMAVKALTDDEKTELKEQFTVLDKAESGWGNSEDLQHFSVMTNHFQIHWLDWIEGSPWPCRVQSSWLEGERHDRQIWQGAGKPVHWSEKIVLWRIWTRE